MHRIIFIAICLLALLGVFGPGKTATASQNTAPQIQTVALPSGR